MKENKMTLDKKKLKAIKYYIDNYPFIFASYNFGNEEYVRFRDMKFAVDNLTDIKNILKKRKINLKDYLD